MMSHRSTCSGSAACSGPMSTVHDLIRWSADPSDMQKFVEKYQKYLPLLVRVSDGYAGRDESLHLFAQNEVYWVYEVLKQHRLIATDRDENYISIPLDYKQRFHIVDRQGNKSPAKFLPDLVDRLKARDVDFMVEGNHQVTFSVGADLNDKKELGLLRYDMLYDLKYLLACPIVDRHLHPRLIAIPTYIPLTLDVAVGFKYGSDNEFQQFCRNLQESVQTFDKMPLTLCQDILLSDEPPESDYEYVNPVHVIIIDDDSARSNSDSSPSPSPTFPLVESTRNGGRPASGKQSGLPNNTYFVPPRSMATIGQVSSCPRFKSKPVMLPPMPPRPVPGAGSAASSRKPAIGPPVPPRKPPSSMRRDATSIAVVDNVESVARRRKTTTGRDGYLEYVRTTSTDNGDPVFVEAAAGAQMQQRGRLRDVVANNAGRHNHETVWNMRRARSMERLDEISQRGRGSGSVGDLDDSSLGGTQESLASTIAARGSGQQTCNRELRTAGMRMAMKGTGNGPIVGATCSQSCNSSPLTRSWDDIGLVPTNIASLSVEEVADCLWLLHLSQYSSAFQQMDVDGQLLVSLNENILVKDFSFSSFDAIKLMKFAVEGWRPLKRSTSPE